MIRWNPKRKVSARKVERIKHLLERERERTEKIGNHLFLLGKTVSFGIPFGPVLPLLPK